VKASPDRPLILGGGIAGIAAAVELARQGLRPILIESRPYLGGRMRSFTHAATGEEIDNGQHLMMGCYHSTFRLLEALGTRQLVELQPSLRVEFRDADGKVDLLRTSSSLPSPLNLFGGMLGLHGLSIGERLSLLRVGLAARAGKVRGEETVREYLNRLGQSQRAQQRLWDPIVIATLNTAPERASAGLFIEVMRRAFLGNAVDSQLGFARSGLSRLIDPAVDYIEQRKGSVLTGTPILGIERHGDHYRVLLKQGEPLIAGRIISALPPHALRSIIARDERLRELLPFSDRVIEYSPIVSLYLWFDRPLDNLPEFCALLGTNVQWMFNRRKIAHGSSARYPGLLSCTISAAAADAQRSADEIIAMAERELRAALPEIGGAKLLEGLVVKEKQATFAATPAAEIVRPGTVTPFSGLYLAGDWTATRLPATIEGGAQSGFEAARCLAGG
jgi:squalene-associated FAD-dependent desaturase